MRNCVIESDGDAAIIMAGQNSQIVNNMIVLGEPSIPTWIKSSEAGNWLSLLFKTPAARKQIRAAIVLQDGSGSVVRGNRIEVKGKSASRYSIYLNNGSKDVLIDGNSFNDRVDAPLTLGADAQVDLVQYRYEGRHLVAVVSTTDCQLAHPTESTEYRRDGFGQVTQERRWVARVDAAESGSLRKVATTPPPLPAILVALF